MDPAVLIFSESTLFHMPKACPYKLVKTLSKGTVEILALYIQLDHIITHHLLVFQLRKSRIQEGKGLDSGSMKAGMSKLSGWNAGAVGVCMAPTPAVMR